ncbi:hypothetical protein E2C01_090193 [Portunus trituberculatus]|uniref:Uncharacterized protein n=1 Tax=Portunus trituberculatus TaxID=210409 RepID=A0A5B7JAU3_PORTR|nr:hypothetical protein [Portunus trituberculatus]
MSQATTGPTRRWKRKYETEITSKKYKKDETRTGIRNVREEGEKEVKSHSKKTVIGARRGLGDAQRASNNLLLAPEMQ